MVFALCDTSVTEVSQSAEAGRPIPTFLTCDAAGRIFEQDGDVLRPTVVNQPTAGSDTQGLQARELVAGLSVKCP